MSWKCFQILYGAGPVLVRWDSTLLSLHAWFWTLCEGSCLNKCNPFSMKVWQAKESQFTFVFRIQVTTPVDGWRIKWNGTPFLQNDRISEYVWQLHNDKKWDCRLIPQQPFLCLFLIYYSSQSSTHPQSRPLIRTNGPFPQQSASRQHHIIQSNSLLLCKTMWRQTNNRAGA